MEAQIITRREEIIRHAERLFAERGFRAANMRELASQVGMEAASLYNHIESKHDILQEICFFTENTFTRGMENILTSIDLPGDQLQEVIRLHIRTIVSNPHRWTVANRDWKFMTEPAQTKYLYSRRGYERKLLSIFENGMTAGIFTPANPRMVVFAFLSSFHWIEQWKGAEPDELQHTMQQFLLKGILSQV